MRVIGIDPGSVITGYGVVESRRRESRLVACGGLRPDAKFSFSERLLEIHDGVLRLVEEYAPDEVAVEHAFYQANVKTLMKMCEARGAIMVALARSDIPVFEYAPREVKLSVVGRGGASKEQVRFMMRNLFGEKRVTGSYDVTDALAVAVCHVNRLRVPGNHGKREGTAPEKGTATVAGRAREGRMERLNEKLSQLGVHRIRATGAKRRGR